MPAFLPMLNEEAITKRIVTHLLAHKEATVTQIMDGTHLARGTVKNYIERWYQKSYVSVRRAQNGYIWTLTETGIQELVRDHVS